MSRAIGPRAPFAGGNSLGAWIVLGLGWGLAALTALAWAGARTAAALTGGHVPPFGTHWIEDLVRLRTGLAWTGTPTALVVAAWTVLA